MKVIIILSLLLLISPAFGELTKEDLRTVVKEEVTASEKRMREYIDLKIEAVNARIDAVNTRIDAVEKSLNARIDGLEKSLNAKIEDVEKNLDARINDVNQSLGHLWLMMIGLLGLLGAAIAVPQIIIAAKDRGQKEMQSQIDQLREKIESMQQ